MIILLAVDEARTMLQNIVYRAAAYKGGSSKINNFNRAGGKLKWFDKECNAAVKIFLIIKIVSEKYFQ